MTPKEKNDWLFFLIVFGPMIIAPVAFGLYGIYNLAIAFIGPVIGISLGHIALATVIIKNRMP